MQVTIEYRKNESKTFEAIARGSYYYFKGYYEYRMHQEKKYVQALVDGEWIPLHVYKAYPGRWKG